MSLWYVWQGMKTNRDGLDAYLKEHGSSLEELERQVHSGNFSDKMKDILQGIRPSDALGEKPIDILRRSRKGR